MRKRSCLADDVNVNRSNLLFPGKRGPMVSSSPKMHPTLQTSIGQEYSLLPNRSSGARYHRVTTISVYCFNGDPYSRARPKSTTWEYQTNTVIMETKRKCQLPQDRKSEEATQGSRNGRQGSQELRTILGKPAIGQALRLRITEVFARRSREYLSLP